MTPEDKAAHANWVYAVNRGQTTLGFDDWRAEQFTEAQDALERKAEGHNARYKVKGDGW